MTKHIKVRSSTGGHDGSSSNSRSVGGSGGMGDEAGELCRFTPSFLWLLRDFFLKLEDEYGRPVSADRVITRVATMGGDGQVVIVERGHLPVVIAFLADARLDSTGWHVWLMHVCVNCATGPLHPIGPRVALLRCPVHFIPPTTNSTGDSSGVSGSCIDACAWHWPLSRGQKRNPQLHQGPVPRQVGPSNIAGHSCCLHECGVQP